MQGLSALPSDVVAEKKITADLTQRYMYTHDFWTRGNGIITKNRN
jgi:hypothetical protein